MSCWNSWCCGVDSLSRVGAYLQHLSFANKKAEPSSTTVSVQTHPPSMYGTRDAPWRSTRFRSADVRPDSLNHGSKLKNMPRCTRREVEERRRLRRPRRFEACEKSYPTRFWSIRSQYLPKSASCIHLKISDDYWDKQNHNTLIRCLEAMRDLRFKAGSKELAANKHVRGILPRNPASAWSSCMDREYDLSHVTHRDTAPKASVLLYPPRCLGIPSHLA